MATTKNWNIVITGAKPLTHGKKNLLDFPYSYPDNPWGAVNFASGFVEACEYINGYTANRPCVQTQHGFFWRFEYGELSGMEVKVVDQDGNLFKGQE